MAKPTSPAHHWKFFRSGGLDQVSLETAADLLALDQLDQKLWVALSCPVKGLEIDETTLKLIDTDNDGHIHAPEVIAAVKWAAGYLKDPADLLRGHPALPLAAINDQSFESQALLASAKQILINLGKKDTPHLLPDDTANTDEIFGKAVLTGEGIIPPEASEDPAVQRLIKEIVASVGGEKMKSGAVGVTSEKIDKFFDELSAYASWVEQSASKDIAILGEATEAAVAALRAVRAKAEDYFGRCRLAAFDARAVGALNRAESEYLAVAAKDLKITADEVSGFPLARVEAGRPLPLTEGVNPAWAIPLATLHRAAVTPVFGAAKAVLTEGDWVTLNGKFAAYETWLGSKVGNAVESLGYARVKEILSGKVRAALTDLIARDRQLEPEFKAISDVHRLVYYYRDLRTVLQNFVNFADFYSRDREAVFQAGTLYVDSRATELCIRVDGPNPLAAMSKAYIAYCTCTRGADKITIAACVTQGDSDYLFVGRHGLFYDRQGRDWDAVVTSIVDNPISIRQAFWSPYKKFIRLIEEQVAKRAAAAEAASSTKLATAAEQVAHADKSAPAPAAPPPKKIDVGTVAALGVAVGAIMGAFGAIATGLAKLAPWQLPLVLVAVMLAISLPSVIIAWLKLRQRTLGPILDGNGWAINGRVKINIPFGSALTEVAHLPPGAKRSLDDPYEDKAAKRRKRWAIFGFIVALLGAAAIWISWDRNQKGRYFWEPEPVKDEKKVATEPAKS